MQQHPLTPSNWKPNTVLISEGGLYRPICESTKPEATRFEKWVFDKVLPTPRETGAYVMTTFNQTHLQFLTEQLAIKDQQLATKDQQLATKDQQLAIKDQQLATKDQLQEEVFRLCDKTIFR